MKTGALTTIASALPEFWKSVLIGRVGNAAIKLIKMGGEGIPEESHAEHDELLVVIDGELVLRVDDHSVTLKSGEFYLIPAGTVHSVPSGSYGTLLLIDK